MLRVLIVDDCEESRYLLETLLKGSGYEVERACDGAEALAKARLNPPQLIISDLLMPVMDGYRLLRQWRADERLRQIPFIVYTATFTDHKDEQLAVSLGADAYILKPAEPEDLIARVKQAVGAPRGEGPPARTVAVAQARTPVAAPEEEEARILGRYSEVLIRKLEDKVLEADRARRELQRDIDERNRTEAALRESELRFRTLANSGQALIWTSGTDKKFDYFNQPLLDFTGRTLEEEMGDGWRNGVHPDDLSRCVETYARAFDRRERFSVEYRLRRQDGEYRWIKNDSCPRFNSEGEFLGYIGHCLDITEHRQTEERLRQQAALLDAASDAIYVRTLDHIVTYWNEGAERIYGWTRTEVLGRKITDFGDADHGAFEAAHAALLAHGAWSGELKKIGRAGKEMLVFCRWTLLRDQQGRPREVLAINTDITEKKQLESNFLRAQRLESIGGLAGGIAHDLNNILTPILMTASLLRETVSDPSSREMLQTVEACAQRGGEIIRQLLTFARGKPGARIPLPVRHLLGEMEKIVRETFPRNIRVLVTAPHDLWMVLGDATQIHQALMNLCVNARDAMPEGGMLTLAAANATIDEKFAAATPEARAGPHVCISVTDTGGGIAPENIDRIFDPFFTTKEIGKGTGLGLPSVLGIVRGHGGFVRVNTSPGSGTTFELFLPASMAAPVAPEASTAVPLSRGAGELILVADDEEIVCGVVQGLLERQGYRVVCANEGEAALALFAQRHTEIKAVLTDLMMPGMDGAALVRALRKLDASLPIVGMTGLGERSDIKGLESLDLPAMLAKPFAKDELLAAVQKALGGK